MAASVRSRTVDTRPVQLRPVELIMLAISAWNTLGGAPGVQLPADRGRRVRRVRPRAPVRQPGSPPRSPPVPRRRRAPAGVPGWGGAPRAARRSWPSVGVDHALGAFTVEHPPRDALVDRQASADPFRLAAAGLGHRVGVSESGAAQRDEVELAVADRLLHVIDQPGQPADADHRHVHSLLDRLGVPHQRTRRDHRQQRHRGVVVAGADVEGVDERVEHLAERESVVKAQTALVGLFDAESIQHREVRSRPAPGWP